MSFPLDARFSESTRGRIVERLRRQPCTVDELAAPLELTDNAVRLHLTALERDGVVRPAGTRRTDAPGKPATLYEIAPDAEPAFSKAYLPFLVTLLGSMGKRLETTAFRGIMRDVGRRLASLAPERPRSREDRVHLASRMLNDLGGVTTVERDEDGALVIQGCGCPLGVAVAERREVCLAMQTMLGEIVGAPVAECCDRAERPKCRFRIPA